MTWTPNTPPQAIWSKDGSTPSNWSLDAPAFAAWGHIPSSTKRIIEGASRRRRVTEQGVIRIIERFKATWNRDPPPVGGWMTH